MPASSKSFVPCVEQMETRIVPAGTVTVKQVGRTFIIRGDNQANVFDVQQDSFFTNDYIIIGFNGTTIRNLNTGSSSFFETFTIGSGKRPILNIKLGGGDDWVTLWDQFASFVRSEYRSVTINGGKGNDILNVWDTNVNGRLKVIGGKGSDNISINEVGVNGSARVLGGRGVDNTTIDGLATGGGMRISLGNKAETLNMFDSDIAGRLAINMGGGRANDSAFLSNVQVQGRLSIVTGAGGDTVGIDTSNSGKGTRIATGNGADRIDLDAVGFFGRTSISTSRGNDTLEIDSFGFNSSFFGKTSFRMGAGRDTIILDVVVSISAVQFLSKRRTLFHGGSGTDTLVQNNAFFVAPPILRSIT